MGKLFVGVHGVEVVSFKAKQGFGVFSDDVDAGAARTIRESDVESVGSDSADHLFAMNAFEKTHFFAIGWSFAVSTGLV